MKLCLDEQIRWQVAEQVRRHGCDAVAITETHLGRRGTPDEPVLLWATSQRRALVTYNEESPGCDQGLLENRLAGLSDGRRVPFARIKQQNTVIMKCLSEPHENNLTVIRSTGSLSTPRQRTASYVVSSDNTRMSPAGNDTSKA